MSSQEEALSAEQPYESSDILRDTIQLTPKEMQFIDYLECHKLQDHY